MKYFLLAATACVGLSACDPCTFHCFGVYVPDTDHSADIGAYRVSVGQIKSDVGHDLPLAYQFSFSWTPDRISQMHRSLGYTVATDEDWLDYQERVFDTAADAGLISYLAHIRNSARETGYEWVVFPNGQIGSCFEGVHSNRSYCNPAPSLRVSQQVALAQEVLNGFRPGCTITTPNPADLIALVGERRPTASDRNLWAVVNCD